MATAIPKGTPAELEKLARSLVQNDATKLAPKFREVTDEVLAALNALGYDAVSHECLRSDELALIYHTLGVSKAVDANHTWHKWGLARDIISKSRGWDVYPERREDGSLHGGDPKWYEPVFRAFEAAGLTLGAHFHSIYDAPHVQWGLCSGSPSQSIIDIGNEEGIEAVWKQVNAC